MGTLDTIKKAQAGLIKKRDELSINLHRAKMRRDFLERGALQPKEFKEHIFAEIDRQAESFPALIEKILSGLSHDREAVERIGRGRQIIPFFGTNENTEEVIKQALFSLVNKELKATISTIIDTTAWPDRTVPLPAEREKEKAALDEKISALNKELNQLDREAEQAGINIRPGIVQDDIPYLRSSPQVSENPPVEKKEQPEAEGLFEWTEVRPEASARIPSKAGQENLARKISSLAKKHEQSINRVKVPE
jgi:hypothetical protein